LLTLRPMLQPRPAATSAICDQSISAVAVRGELVALGGAQGLVELRSVYNGQLVAQFEGHSMRVSAIRFTPRGLLTSSLDGRVVLWDDATGKPRLTWEDHRSGVTDVLLVDDLLISGGDDQQVQFRDLCNDTSVVLRVHINGITCLASEGELVIAGSRDSRLAAWDHRGGPHWHEGHEGMVTCCVVHRGVVISGGRDGTIRMWRDAVLLSTLQAHEGAVRALAVSDDGQTLASSGDDHRILLHLLPEGSVFGAFYGHERPVVALAWSGDLLVSGSEDRTVRTWAMEALSPPGWRPMLHRASVRALASSRGRLVSGSRDYRLQIWDVGPGRWLHTLEGHEGGVVGVAVDPAGHRFLSASTDGTLRTWDLHRGACMSVVHQDEQPLCCCAWLGVRHVLAGSRDHNLRVVDLVTGESTVVAGHTARVRGVAVHEMRVATASYDGTVKVWCSVDWTLERTHQLPDKVIVVAFDQGGVWLAAGVLDGSVHVWNAQTGEPSWTMQEHDEGISALCFTEYGLVSASKDGTVRLWSVQDGTCYRVLVSGSPVDSVCVVKNGIAVGLVSGAIRIVDLARKRRKRSA
jgi:WD40 repeat protein